MSKINLVIAAVLGLVAVVLGAFGAHALKGKLDPDTLKSFETGVRYMMYHVIVILIVNSQSHLSMRAKNSISALFLTGILLFSGSLFVIALELLPPAGVWFITPIGGFFFIAGWLHLAISFLKSNRDHSK